LNLIHILDRALGPHDKIWRKNEVSYKCPNPSCTSDKAKLIINTEKCMYQCWVCDFKGRPKKKENKLNCIIRLFLKIGKRSEAEELAANTDFYGLKDIEEVMAELTQEIIIESVEIPDGYEKLYQKKHSMSHINAFRYMRERGLSQRDLIMYDVMYSVAERKILFPSYDKDFNLNFYVSRSVDYTYYQNPDISKTNIIFNEHFVDWDSDIYLVEGIFDAIISRKNAIPLLGSSLKYGSLLFRKIVQHDASIILCLDPDAQEKQMRMLDFLVRCDVSAGYVDLSEAPDDIAGMGTNAFDYFVSHNTKQYGFKENITHMLKEIT
jgi:hypothetical protein